ncbi:hypothetical protein Q4F19_01215 [Sphingomonas sp. BIUV-7]|uniref:Uncharacterized protein n=1 Tax=Sphingomonas natans TaxID=3063330 RepID=A0ABT8Y3V8_9SPHN|nr:hypothetical protein [Sphingomonas sp. BIUV-7]MDO6412991.1 hypothetical protein [Sphingomonas sp. BIUV-7]
MTRRILLPLAAIALTPVAASTPAAWSAMHIAARRACIAAAGLRAPSVSNVLDFSDTSAKTALLVRGTYTQRFMKGASGTFLCLYDRRTKKAEAMEAPGFVFDEAAAAKP